MSLFRRTVLNTTTNIVGLGLNSSLQLLQVPLLIAIWGTQQYGYWVVLSTIPTYVALSDFGFTTASTSDMTMSYARGEKDKTLTTYQSMWAMLVLVSGLVSVAALPIMLVKGANMPTVLQWASQFSDSIYFFILYSAVALCSRVLLSGLRSTGYYALGTFFYEFLGFCEAILVVVAAWRGADFNVCILTITVWRLLSIVVLDQVLRRLVPGMMLGFRHAQVPEIRRLAYPAITAMTVPIALAINIQGMIVVVGAVLSAQAVAVFSAVRTASRITLQIVSALNRGSMPEMSRAASLKDRAAIARVIRLNLITVGIVLLPGAALFAIFGKFFVRTWTLGKIDPEPAFVILMASAMFFQGLWFFASNLLVAINGHADIAKFLLGIALLSIVVSALAGSLLGLDGIALALSLAELAAVCFVYKEFRNRLLSPSTFGR